MAPSKNQARRAQGFADERKLDDAHAQRGTIIGDVDGAWLIGVIESLWHADYKVRSGEARCFRFLADGKEAVLSQLSNFDSASAIEMPASSIIRKVEGHDFDTWVFRVYDGYEGVDGEHFDVAYREIETGDHLLYLKSHYPIRASAR